MKLQYLAIFLIVTLLSAGLNGCQMTVQQSETNDTTQLSEAPTTATVAADELHREGANYLYTVVNITTYGKLEQSIYQEIWQALDQIDQTMSMGIAESEIAAINKAAGQAPVVVSDAVYQLIKEALTYSEISDDFDISIGALVQLWDIGGDNPHLPEAAEIERVLQTINYRDVVLDDAAQSVFLSRENMAIDLGSIAKGYAADLTRQILLKHGVDKAIINFGGNILTIGNKLDGTPWNIGIQDPLRPHGSYLGIYQSVDHAVVTSGIYERYFEKDGRRYHHILSPKDGYPIDNELASVSIIASQSTICDALSTLIFAQGVERGLKIIEDMPDVEAIFITREKTVIVSDGLKDSFRIVNPIYRLVEVER